MKRSTYMVQEHHVAVLLANHVSVLCMRLYVSSGSHTQYTYMIGSGAQSCGASEPCKYFSKMNGYFYPSARAVHSLAELSQKAAHTIDMEDVFKFAIKPMIPISSMISTPWVSLQPELSCNKKSN